MLIYNCIKNGNNGIHDMNNEHYGDDGGGRKESLVVFNFLRGCYREVFHSSLLWEIILGYN